MSGILIDDFEPFEGATFRTMRPPYVLTSISSGDPPLFKQAWRQVVTSGEPWTNATGILFAKEELAELAVGDEQTDNELLETFIADCEQPRPVEVLAKMFDMGTRPIEHENVALPFDPDDCPLF
jgi:hypothetical protein